MKLRFKKLHPDATLPEYAHPGDGAIDLKATSKEYSRDCVIYGTGLAVEIPQGFVGLVFPRSSIYKTAESMANSVAVIDFGFSGEVKLVFRRYHPLGKQYEIGDKIGQLMVVEREKLEPEWADELSVSERGNKGFGSTGK